MPIKKSAKKELRKSHKRHLKNIGVKSDLKTRAKQIQILISEKKLDQAKEALKKLASRLDKAASKNIIHKNTASRKKSRLAKKITSSSRSG